jgi:hypothetical protein
VPLPCAGRTTCRKESSSWSNQDRNKHLAISRLVPTCMRMHGCLQKRGSSLGKVLRARAGHQLLVETTASATFVTSPPCSWPALACTRDGATHHTAPLPPCSFATAHVNKCSAMQAAYLQLAAALPLVTHHILCQSSCFGPGVAPVAVPFFAVLHPVFTVVSEQVAPVALMPCQRRRWRRSSHNLVPFLSMPSHSRGARPGDRKCSRLRMYPNLMRTCCMIDEA